MRNAALLQVERLEDRRLLSAVVVSPDPAIVGLSPVSPLPPMAGHSLYVSGNTFTGGAISTWANASAITPNIVNDLVLNVLPFSTNYVAGSEGAGGTLGAALLTNGLTQSQIGPSPSPGAAAVGDGGASDASSNTNVISDATAPYFFSYQLGTAGGQAPSANGYDLSEIDLITGHQDTRTSVDPIDILVEPVGSSQFLSLSGGAGFSLIEVPDGKGGSIAVLRGGAQMAIVNSSGGPLATNIQAVKLAVLDPSTWMRELVVTGTPSAAAPPAAPVAPTGVVATLGGGGVTVSWNASANAPGYTLLRSANPGGPYAAVGSVTGQTSLVDPTAAIGATYSYEVIAAGDGDSTPSASSAPFTVPSFGATEYLFKNQGWSGAVTATVNLPLINSFGGQNAPLTVAPLASGINPNAFSALIEGKITTDRAGTYSFAVDTDDDGYLYVNGQLVSSNAGPHAEKVSTANTPIVLAANTSYGFEFLENQRTANWAMKMEWSEPQADGSAGPLKIVPATSLTPAVDNPAAPQNVSTIASDVGVQLNWTPAADASSLAYVIERAPADSSGNATGPFAAVGQVFSGPAPGSSGAAAWGASSFVDTTAAPATSYLYEVGPITPSQTIPSSLSATVPASTLVTGVSVSLNGGTLSVQLGLNDSATISETAGQISVNEGATTVFTADPTTVSALSVAGTAAAPGTVNLTGAMAFSGSVAITQIKDLTLGGSLNASAISATVSDNITVGAPLTSSGPVSLTAANNVTANASITSAGTASLIADSDENSAGTLFIAAGQTLNSGGNPITLHGTTLTLSGTVNSGAGNVTYELVPGFSTGSLLARLVSSGTVLITSNAQTGGVNFSETSGPGVTGTVIYSFPAATFSTNNSFNTSAGNANLQILAPVINLANPVTTGTGSLLLQASSGGTLSNTIKAGSVALLGGNFTFKSFLTVATQLQVGGNLTIANGAITVGSALQLLNGATISMNSSGSVSSQISFNSGSASISGVGQILFASGSVAAPNFIFDSQGLPSTLSIAPGITISATTGDGDLGLFNGNQISNQGTITVQSGQQLLVQSFLDNTGTIAVSGGTLQLNSTTNEGVITDSGGEIDAFSLVNSGTILLTNANIFAPITTYGDIEVTNGGANFYDFVDQEAGTIKTTNAVADYFAGASIAGMYTSDPADNYFGGLTIQPTGALIGGAGDRFFMLGEFINYSTQTALWNTTKAELHFTGGTYHQLNNSGPAGTFAWGTLAVDPGDTVDIDGNSFTAAATVNNGTIELFSGTDRLGKTTGAGSITADTVINVSSLTGNSLLAYGQPDVLIATVSPQAQPLPAPGGQVQFYANGILLGNGTLDRFGRAFLVTTHLGLGVNTITAYYLGAGIFLPSFTNNPITQVTTAGVVLLDQSGRGSLTVSGNAQVDVNGAPIVVDSSNAAAIAVSGNGQVRASELDVTGGISRSGNGRVSGVVDHNAAAADPLAFLEEPYPYYLNAVSAAQLVISKGQVTLDPGVYVGGIKITGGVVTLDPGIYYMQGGGFAVSGKASVTDNGQGVMIYSAPNSVKDAISFTGSGKVTLSPITSGEYQGLVLFQDRTSAAPISISGNGNLHITGTIYAAAATLSVTGNGGLDASGNPLDQIGSSLIVDDLNVSGNGSIQISEPTVNWQRLLAAWLGL